MKKTLAVMGMLALSAAVANASVIYDADFVSQNVSIDHDTGGNSLETSPQAGANFEIGYPSPPSSDTTRNYLETDGGNLDSSDFGGDHYFQTDIIDVSGWNEVEIDIICNFVGSDSFNNSPTEFIQYVYTLDGGSDQQFFYFTDDPNGSDLNASETVDVTNVLELVVRINANANGSGDGWSLSSAKVTGTVVPEPATMVLLGLGGVAALIRRRRA